MEQRILDAIDIFLDAINQNKLGKGQCVTCAVGNLVRHYNGKEDVRWKSLFITAAGKQHIRIEGFKHLVNKGLSSIEKVPFTENELAQIEFAFETNTKILMNNYCHHSKEEVRADQIKGLTAVIEVMKGFKPQENQNLNIQEMFTNKVVA